MVAVVRHPPKRMNGVVKSLARYMIANKKSDYDQVYDYLKGTEFEKLKVTFPTIIAYIDDEMRGVLGTIPSKDAIIAGPLLIKDKSLRRATLEMKLVDAYESLLINMGVEAYIFSVDKSNVGRVNMLKEIGLTPYAKEDDLYWYLRRF